MSAWVSGAMSGASSGAQIGTSIMPGWGTAIGGVVGGLAGGIMGGKSDAKRKRAERARRKLVMEDFRNKQALMKQEQQLREPLMKMIPEAMSDQPLDYAQAATQIRENYAKAIRNLSRDSASGLGASTYRSAALGMERDLAQSYLEGRQKSRGLRMQLGSMAQPLQASRELSGAYGQREALESEKIARAEQEAQDLSNSLSQAGQGMGGMMGGMGGGQAAVGQMMGSSKAMGAYSRATASAPPPTQQMSNTGPYGQLPVYGGMSQWDYMNKTGSYPALYTGGMPSFGGR